jgi:hypothetical protein
MNQAKGAQMEEVVYKNAKGETKYYASYHTAWKACIRLNRTETTGTWRFEGDAIGWYCHFEEESN